MRWLGNKISTNGQSGFKKRNLPPLFKTSERQTDRNLVRYSLRDQYTP